MKNQLKVLMLAMATVWSLAVVAQDATEIVQKADQKFNGEKSSYSEMTMTIVRPKYTRNISFKNWTEGTKLAMTLITAPAQDKGQSFLKNGNNMWNWNPTIQRLIKLPPSMMSQGWMGSDYTNDDLLKESSIVSDYTHKILKMETLEGYDCYVIQMMPKPNADVVWGKIVMWISKDGYMMMKSEYYDEDLTLVKTNLSHNVKNFDGRTLPSVMEIIPADEKGNKTVVDITSMTFNHSMGTGFYSQQNMKRLK